MIEYYVGDLLESDDSPDDGWDEGLLLGYNDVGPGGELVEVNDGKRDEWLDRILDGGYIGSRLGCIDWISKG